MFAQIFIGGLLVGSIYALMALGYSLIYSASGLMTFAQGDIFMLSAFLALTFFVNMGLPFWLTLLLTLGLMFVFGLLVDRFMIAPLLRRGSTVIYIVLATISLSYILQNGAMLVWGTEVLPFPSVFGDHAVMVGTVPVVPQSLWILGISLLGMVGLHLFMTRTRFGTALRASAQDKMAASVLGINVPFTIAFTWALASTLAAVGGVLIAPVFGVYTVMGGMIGMKGFAAAVIGGYGNMYGAMLGGLLLGLIETIAAGYVSSNFKDFIAFTVLIVMLVAMPQGILRANILEES